MQLFNDAVSTDYIIYS